MSRKRRKTRRRGGPTPSPREMDPSQPSNANKPVGHNRISVWAVCLFIVIATFVVFGQTVGHDFVDYDDQIYVYENPNVTGGLTSDGIAWAFTSTDNFAFNWHPLTWLSHMLDCQIYGLWPGGHHLTSVAIHAASAVLLLFVLLRMTGSLWPSAFVAVVFAPPAGRVGRVGG